MGNFDQDAFNEFLVEQGVIGFFAEGRILKSGRFSYWYVNCRILASTVGLIDQTAGYVEDFLDSRGLDCDYLYGVPAGVTALATVVNYKRGMASNPGHPLVIGREAPKQHGDPRDRFFVGPVRSGDRAVVLEDVTTTGGSLLAALDSLAEAGVEVTAAVSLVNRLEVRDDGRTVEKCVEEKGSRYLAMTDAEQVIPLALARAGLGPEFLGKFQEKYNEVAVRKIDLGGRGS